MNKLQNMEISKLRNLTALFRSFVIVLVVLILIFSYTSYVFKLGYDEHQTAIRYDENGVGHEIILLYDNGVPEPAEIYFDGYHLSYKFPNELVSHLGLVLVISLFLPLIDKLMKQNLMNKTDRDTLIAKYTFNKIIVGVLLVIFIIFLVTSIYFSIAWIKNMALYFETYEGSGYYLQPCYTYDWDADRGEAIYRGIAYH